MSAMKLQHSFRIIFAGALIVLMAACATAPTSGPAALVGTWTNTLGTVWTVNADGTFQVDLTKDGKPDVWGHYTVSGDTLTISEVRGKTPKACKQPATYKFNRMGDQLHFTLVSDKCKLRIQNVTQPWTKK
jgi:Family of unknown function (DUF5640)